MRTKTEEGYRDYFESSHYLAAGYSDDDRIHRRRGRGSSPVKFKTEGEGGQSSCPKRGDCLPPARPCRQQGRIHSRQSYQYRRYTHLGRDQEPGHRPRQFPRRYIMEGQHAKRRRGWPVEDHVLDCPRRNCVWRNPTGRRRHSSAGYLRNHGDSRSREQGSRGQQDQ